MPHLLLYQLRYEVGLGRWVFNELRDIAEMKFRFAEEEDACEYVTRLAAEMHQFPPAHCLKVRSIVPGLAIPHNCIMLYLPDLSR